VKSVSRVCENCGERVLEDAPKGLCPACVLETGLGPLADEAVAGIDSSAVASANAGDSGPAADVLKDFGDYELLEEIGRGGQGVVYRARQKSLNRTVALKVIGLGQWAMEAHLKRFRREAEAAANLDHPCIVPIYEVSERGGSCYFSMKFIDGGQLDEVIKRTPISIRNAAELIAKLARTVHYAHEHGILHRDIKPGNILVDAKGEPHLTDFGLARLLETKSTVTHTMDVLGTPSYMAPEQASGRNEELTSATDVHGLGAAFYHLLTGHPPFAGGTTYETVRLVLETEPRQPRLWNPKIDRELSTICLKCLEKDPKRRYASALALAEDLEHWLKHEPIRAKRSGLVTRARKWVRRNPAIAALIASLVALAAAMSWNVWKSELISRPATKGIAVLPFENLGGDKENAVFADGVQDDVLTKLAKIADLKVISRTSVMPYRGARNTRQIGNALGVSHVLEGSVQRAGSKVRVNAQLIDTRTDTHVWAEEYDRDLSDIFAVQSEIAQRIADQLQAKVSAAEKAAIAERRTKDLAAYDLYASATALIDAADPPSQERDGDLLRKAVDLLNQAVARDPAFLLAYCRLARAHDALYFHGFDRTGSRLALANDAINSAFQLKPSSDEAHLALARHRYWGYLDYDQARDELAIAARTLPNDARVFQLAGQIDRKNGRWRDAVRNFERAVELDPQNAEHLVALRDTYLMMRAYKQARETADRRLALKSNALWNNAFEVIFPTLPRFQIDLDERADTRPLHAVMEKTLRNNPEAAGRIVANRFILALYERDFAAADRVLASLTDREFGEIKSGIYFNRAIAEAVIARAKGDVAAAHDAFAAARPEVEKAESEDPSHGGTYAVLGLAYAGCGLKEEALREGRRALELTPVAKDAVNGAGVLYFFAIICAWSGERDLALEQLETLAKIPAGASYGDLRLDPSWDLLRSDPRFEKIVASLAPK
jgi:TolB-like protein/Tfp pilus assembly protein PilF/predicted Ser/Thr protein kinase